MHYSKLGGWGGRVVNFEDAAESDAPPDDPNPAMMAVYRWRPAWQAEFQVRLDWCVRDPEKASHPPTVKLKVNGLQRKAYVPRGEGRAALPNVPKLVAQNLNSMPCASGSWLDQFNVLVCRRM
jgi:hypothetical protein